MNKCKACNAPLHWVTTPGGKNMPCDAKPVWFTIGGSDVKGVVVTSNGEIVNHANIGRQTTISRVGYIPHWATCPAAKSFKRRQK